MIWLLLVGTVLLKVLASIRLISFSRGQNKILGVLSSLDITTKCMKAMPAPISSMVPPLVAETCIGYLSPLSKAQVRKDIPTCFKLLTQLILWHLLCPRVRPGTKTVAQTAM